MSKKFYRIETQFFMPKLDLLELESPMLNQNINKLIDTNKN